MSPVVIPAGAAARAPATPSSTASTATPRARWACGSTNSSTWRTPAAAARARYACVIAAKSAGSRSTAMFA
ncbi:hypothetical protein BJ983_002452 [Actinomycetospora corticicola]|uniref:Uncharacterized protein n=1 Tax=Actinomycetospora corticicola TaxID=663602 RepID=A0A7Y9DVN0_9PSEU|nr:hypothetical protein [Actinomycetospora corticicola]